LIFFFILCRGLPSAVVVTARSMIKISYVYLIIGLDLGFEYKIGRVKYTDVSHVLKRGGVTNINRFIHFCCSLFARHHWVILGIRFDWHWEYKDMFNTTSTKSDVKFIPVHILHLFFTELCLMFSAVLI
jgi:hypothetical protein